MAAKAGLSVTHVANLYRGYRWPTINTHGRLAPVLRVPKARWMEVLFPGGGDHDPSVTHDTPPEQPESVDARGPDAGAADAA